jgi:hypothetical protein
MIQDGLRKVETYPVSSSTINTRSSVFKRIRHGRTKFLKEGWNVAEFRFEDACVSHVRAGGWVQPLEFINLLLLGLILIFPNKVENSI